MKVNIQNRILPLLLALLLLPCMLAFPARAEDIGPWLNVLDFSTANGSGSNFFNVTSGQVVEYDIPGSSLVTSVDLVVYSLNDLTGADISRNGTSWQTATVTDLGDSYYRITLDTNRVFQGVYMRFFFDESGANTMQVISLKVAVADMAKYYIPINGTVYDYASSPTKELSIVKNADNLASNTVSWFPNNDSTITYFRASLPLTEWYKYDKIHVVISLYSATFDSIDVTHSGYAVPFEYNLIESQSGGTHIFYIDLVIDVSGFDRAVSSPVTIQLSGTSTRNNDSLNKMTIYSALGVIVGDTIDPTTFWFTSLQGWLAEQTTAFSSALSDLGANINTWISDQTTSIVDGITLAIKTGNAYLNNIYARIILIPTQIGEQTRSIVESISTWGQNIVDALNPEADTNEFRDEVENIRDQMQDANNAMNELERPSVDDVFSEVDLDVGEGSNFAAIMGSFFENDFIVSIITASLAFSIFGLLIG